MSGHGQLQIHERLDVRAVEVECALAKIKQAKRGHDADDAQHRGNAQHHAHVPGLGLILVMNVVIGNGQDGAVVEQRQHHDHHRRQRIKIKDQDRQRHEQQYAQRLGDTVDRIAVHPLEYFPALLDRVDNHRQAGCHQHDGRRRARRIRRTGNGDAAVSFLQRRCVIHPVAHHADDVAALLQDIHNVEFVFGEYLGEAIRLLDRLRKRRHLVTLRVTEAAGIEDIRAHP
jgi:hypothetical protein